MHHYIGPWPSLEESDVFPEMFKSARAVLEMTQAELASALKVTRLSVARWESGEATPSPKRVAPVVSTLTRLLREKLIERFAEIRRAARRKAMDGRLVSFDTPLESDASLADLLAGVMVGRGRTLLKKEAWVAALSIGERLFEGMPAAAAEDVPVSLRRDGVPRFWGFDVGYALMGAVQGTTYRGVVAGDEERFNPTVCLLAEQRLMNECRFRLNELATYGLGIEQFMLDRMAIDIALAELPDDQARERVADRDAVLYVREQHRDEAWKRLQARIYGSDTRAPASKGRTSGRSARGSKKGR